MCIACNKKSFASNIAAREARSLVFCCRGYMTCGSAISPPPIETDKKAPGSATDKGNALITASAFLEAATPSVEKNKEMVGMLIASTFLTGAAHTKRIQASEKAGGIDEHVFFVSYQPPTPRTKRVSVEGSASGVVIAAKTPTCAVCLTPLAEYCLRIKWAGLRSTPWVHLSCRRMPTIPHEGCLKLHIHVEGVEALEAADAQTVEAWQQGVMPLPDALTERARREQAGLAELEARRQKAEEVSAEGMFSRVAERREAREQRNWHRERDRKPLSEHPQMPLLLLPPRRRAPSPERLPSPSSFLLTGSSPRAREAVKERACREHEKCDAQAQRLQKLKAAQAEQLQAVEAACSSRTNSGGALTLPSPRAHEIQQRAADSLERHGEAMARHRVAIQAAEERAELAWLAQHLGALPAPLPQPRYLVIEPRIPLILCRPPPFRPLPQPDLNSSRCITHAELLALPLRIRMAFEREPDGVEMSFLGASAWRQPSRY